MRAGGAIDVTVSTNNVATLAATTSAGTISYRDSNGFTVNTVGAQTLGGNTFSATDGVSTTGTGTDILLQSGGTGTLTLSHNVNANAGANDVRLISGGQITQTANSITADELGMRAGGAIDVTVSTNNVATLAATTSAGTISYRDSNGFTVNTVGAQTLGGNTFSATDGVSTTGTGTDILLQSGGTGTLTLSHNVNANAGANDVRLISGGQITQTANSITADELGMRAGGAIDVTVSTNNVATLAATTSAGTISYRDSNGFTVNTVGAQTLGGNTFSATDGVSTTGTGTDILLQSGGTGTLTLSHNVNANAGANDVRLISGGQITQTANSITADELGMRAGGAIDVTVSTNNVATLAATTSAGTISYRDSNGFTVNTVGAQTLGGNTFSATDGVSTTGTGTDILLQSGGTGTLTLSHNVNANAGANDVRLISGGQITQTANSITADELGMRAGGAIDVTVSTNNVATLAATTSAGTISYRDSNGFTVNTVGAQTLGGNTFSATDGVSTTGTGTDILLQSGGTGTLTLSHNVNANAGANDVRLISGGQITQTANSITDDELGKRAGGAIDVTVSTNNVATLAATTSAGTISIRDSNGFTDNPVGDSIPTRRSSDLTDGVSTTGTGTDILLQSGGTGTLTLSHNVNANAGANDVRLISGGQITQTANSITADELGMRAGGAIDVTVWSNNVGRLAATVRAG